tara:strand:- start:458 stop:763 length:306 start_codon:yes stop_codon:yes gene_type:complete
MITNIGLKQLGYSEEDYVLQDDGNGTFIAEWKSDKPQPSEERITLASLEAQAEHDSKAYARARAEAYPSIADQLDMQYHDQTEGSRTWLDAIEAVKEAHPK